MSARAPPRPKMTQRAMRRMAIKRGQITMRAKTLPTSSTLSAGVVQEMTVTRRRHPPRPRQVAFPDAVCAIGFTVGIEMEHDPRHFTPVGAFGFSVEKAQIGDPVQPVIVGELARHRCDFVNREVWRPIVHGCRPVILSVVEYSGGELRTRELLGNGRDQGSRRKYPPATMARADRTSRWIRSRGESEFVRHS